MGFSAKQVQALRRPLDHRYVRTRELNGRERSYIEGWYAISEANRIFGFDGWSRESVETRCVLARENRGTFLAVYTAKVRLTAQARDTTIVREGHGTGEGRGTSPGEVHDIALKAAETDATKRALATFGSPFGLDLYGNGRAPSRRPLPATSNAEPAERLPGFHPDDTTPIPRPSRHYGRREGPPVDEHLRRERRKAEREAAPPLAPETPNAPARIDKSQLPIGEPKRIRDKEHLKFVASQPCLLCGRQPCDAHHLRFAQPRAIGMKVSDEFTVPLCRTHHKQLHEAGNEVAWWEDFDINALEIAKGLWEESRGKGQGANSEPVDSKSTTDK
jgi:hypothetical protein